jgi:hypothetical protein
MSLTHLHRVQKHHLWGAISHKVGVASPSSGTEGIHWFMSLLPLDQLVKPRVGCRNAFLCHVDTLITWRFDKHTFTSEQLNFAGRNEHGSFLSTPSDQTSFSGQADIDNVQNAQRQEPWMHRINLSKHDLVAKFPGRSPRHLSHALTGQDVY